MQLIKILPWLKIVNGNTGGDVIPSSTLVWNVVLTASLVALTNFTYYDDINCPITAAADSAQNIGCPFLL